MEVCLKEVLIVLSNEGATIMSARIVPIKSVYIPINRKYIVVGLFGIIEPEELILSLTAAHSDDIADYEIQRVSLRWSSARESSELTTSGLPLFMDDGIDFFEESEKEVKPIQLLATPFSYYCYSTASFFKVVLLHENDCDPICEFGILACKDHKVQLFAKEQFWHIDAPAFP